MVDTISTLSMLPTLPAELQRNIFLHCDPHTLYTCVRFLNKDWHRAVQQELLAAQFRSKDWRVGLRITKRAPFTRPTNVLEQQTAQADERADEQIRQLNASRPGTREDALSPTPIAGPTVHVIPLRFTSYKESNTTLAFSTGNEWHALFEGMQVPEAGRLDLDFALVWRFPGDGGQEADMPGGDGWGTPDAENGWLSRFYCVSAARIAFFAHPVYQD